MGKPAFPFAPPGSLAAAVDATNLADGVGGRWDLGLDGFGYLLSTLDQESPFEFRSYEIQAIPTQKPRIDDAEEPGEQTLAAWWARAQHSWHEGAGQKIFDSPFSSRFAFTRSKGMDIWEKGELTLLRAAYDRVNYAVGDLHIITVNGLLYWTHNGEITKDPDPDTGGDEVHETTNTGTEINSITTDGEFIYAAYSGGTLGIRKIPAVALTPWTLVNSHTDVDIIAFVKGRLIGAKGNQVFDYDLGVTTAPEPFYTDKSSAWAWTAITESGPAVYFSGFAGDRSEIYAARLTAQDIPYAALATLGALRSVWTAPEGETIHSIKGYIGQGLLIGTSRGVRVATIVSGDGDLRVSELIVETDSPVLWFDPQLEYAWFGWTNYDAVSSGLGRVHLGDLVYASDLMWTGQGDVLEVVAIGDRKWFVVDAGTNQYLVQESLTEKVTDGSLEHDEIRFNTTERKVVRYFDLLISGNGKWSLELGQDDTSPSPVNTDTAVSGYTEEVIDMVGTRFYMKLSLTRDSGDVSLAPLVKEWRMRAEPRATGRFRYLVPIMVYDQMVDNTGKNFGKAGHAWELLNRFKTIYRNDSDVIFQPPEVQVPNGEAPVQVKMEDMRFKAYAPPNGGKGFGGVVLLVLREVR